MTSGVTNIVHELKIIVKIYTNLPVNDLEQNMTSYGISLSFGYINFSRFILAMKESLNKPGKTFVDFLGTFLVT